MNLLSISIVMLGVALAIIVPLLVVGAYRKFRGTRIITCPETGEPAAVEVDAAFAGISAICGEPSLRLKTCSRWPERKDCGQECLAQIEATPEDCMLRTVLAKWYTGRPCAVCGRLIGAVMPDGQLPALMDSAGRTFEWQAFPPEKIPEALRTHRPVCWICHVAESTRHAKSPVGAAPG